MSLTQILRPAIKSGYTTLQLAILARMAEYEGPPMSVRELAADIHVQKPYISRAFDKLNKAGVTTRRKSQADRRKVVLGITKKGRKFVASLTEGLS